MGLDFTYQGADEDRVGFNAPRWAYSGFMKFRCRVAAHYGVEIDPNPFTGNYGDRIKAEIPNDHPIFPLLYHSDCDEEMTPEECALVAPELRKVVQGWPEGDYDRETALQLVAMMYRCVERNTNLIFC